MLRKITHFKRQQSPSENLTAKAFIVTESDCRYLRETTNTIQNDRLTAVFIRPVVNVR